MAKENSKSSQINEQNKAAILEEVKKLIYESLEDYLKIEDSNESMKAAIQEYNQDQEDKFQDEMDAIHDMFDEKTKEVDMKLEMHDKSMKSKHQLQDDVIDYISRSINNEIKKKLDLTINVEQCKFKLEMFKKKLDQYFTNYDIELTYIKSTMNMQNTMQSNKKETERSGGSPVDVLAAFKSKMVDKFRAESGSKRNLTINTNQSLLKNPMD